MNNQRLLLLFFSLRLSIFINRDYFSHRVHGLSRAFIIRVFYKDLLTWRLKQHLLCLSFKILFIYLRWWTFIILCCFLWAQTITGKYWNISRLFLDSSLCRLWFIQEISAVDFFCFDNFLFWCLHFLSSPHSFSSRFKNWFIILITIIILLICILLLLLWVWLAWYILILIDINIYIALHYLY